MKGSLSGLQAEFIEEFEDFQPLFNDGSLGVIEIIHYIVHEMNIGFSEAMTYVDLFHLDSSFSPPLESNMFLNFCTMNNVFSSLLTKS